MRAVARVLRTELYIGCCRPPANETLLIPWTESGNGGNARISADFPPHRKTIIRPAAAAKNSMLSIRWRIFDAGIGERQLRRERERLLQLLLARQQRRIPRAAQRLDQVDAGEEQILANRQLGHLVVQ